VPKKLRPGSVEGIEVGDELPAFEPDIRMETVRRFARTAGMLNPRFTDHEGARKQGLPGAIVPGIMSQGMLAALVHRFAPGSRIRRIDTVFRAPILVGERALCKGVVTEVHKETRTIDVDLVIENEAGEGRVLGTATVEL
jgi:acyl dehydratase